MDLKCVKNISQNGVVTMQLFDEIGGDGIPGSWIASDIKYLNEYTDTKEINLEINSPGGSVLDGFSIISAMLNSNVPVNTFNSGVAASMAAIVLAVGKKRRGFDYSKIMVHDPFSDSAGDDKALEALKDSLLILLDNNSEIDKEVIDVLMGEETWFGAKDAEKGGLIDQIVSTERKIKATNNVMEIYNKAKEFNSSNNKPKMLKIKNTLGLDENSSEEVVNTKVVDIKNKVTELEGEVSKKDETIAEKDKEIEELKAANIAHVKNAATTLVENAIEEGKIDKSKKDEMIKSAENNFEGVKNIIDAIPAKAPKSINNQLGGGSSEPKNSDEDLTHEGKSFRELEKSNPSALRELKNSNSEKYFSMYKNQYGKKHPEDVAAE